MVELVPARFDKLARSEERWRGYLERIQAKDPHSLTQLYDETSAILFGLAVRMLADPAAAEEVILDVYQQIWNQAGDPDRSPGSVLALLTVLTRRCAGERMRKNGPRGEAGSNTGFPASASISTGEGMFGRECKVVQQALAALPAEQRVAIELAFFGGLNDAELAQQLGMPVVAVKRRIRVGMGKLREVLQSVAPMEHSA